MKLTTGRKLLIGAASFFPIVYIAAFLIVVFSVFAASNGGAHKEGSPSLVMLFPILIVLHLFTMFLIYALMAFYIYVIIKKEAFSALKKTVWIVVLFFLNFLAMPIFWQLHIWPADEI